MKFINYLIAKTLPFIPEIFIKKVSSRYIAGETIGDAIAKVRDLNKDGISATIDVLGEFIKTKEEATENAEEYIELLHILGETKLDANISIKPTSMGLLLDEEFCYQTMKSIIDVAKKYNIFVRIDMEDVECTNQEIELLFNLRKEYKNIGIVLQAYLKRTYDDIEKMIKEKINLRLCKGIYIEEPVHLIENANQDRLAINPHFLAHIKRMFETKTYVGIATHDEIVVNESLKLIKELKVDNKDYEFQMLLGVRDYIKDRIVKDGHKMRIYIPYGKDWYGYSVRRLNENPSIAGYVLKAMFTGK